LVDKGIETMQVIDELMGLAKSESP